MCGTVRRVALRVLGLALVLTVASAACWVAVCGGALFYVRDGGHGGRRQGICKSTRLETRTKESHLYARIRESDMCIRNEGERHEWEGAFLHLQH